MSLVEYAKRELEASGAGDSLYGELIPNAVLELIEVFANQGHSGMSAPIVIQLFKQVASYEPLCPLTGKDDEWTEIRDGEYQNKRCSHVFKNKDGAYDIDGKVFKEPNGACYTSGDSRVPVTFPYTPKSKYVDVPTRGDKGFDKITTTGTKKLEKGIEVTKDGRGAITVTKELTAEELEY